MTLDLTGITPHTDSSTIHYTGTGGAWHLEAFLARRHEEQLGGEEDVLVGRRDRGHPIRLLATHYRINRRGSLAISTIISHLVKASDILCIKPLAGSMGETAVTNHGTNVLNHSQEAWGRDSSHHPWHHTHTGARHERLDQTTDTYSVLS